MKKLILSLLVLSGCGMTVEQKESMLIIAQAHNKLAEKVASMEKQLKKEQNGEEEAGATH